MEIIELKKKNAVLQEELDELREGSFKIRRELDARDQESKANENFKVKAEEMTKQVSKLREEMDTIMAQIEETADFFLEVKPKSLKLVSSEIESVITELEKAAEFLHSNGISGDSRGFEGPSKTEDDFHEREEREATLAAASACIEALKKLQLGEKESLFSYFRTLLSILEDLFLKTESTFSVSVHDSETSSFSSQNKTADSLLKCSRGLLDAVKFILGKYFKLIRSPSMNNEEGKSFGDSLRSALVVEEKVSKFNKLNWEHLASLLARNGLHSDLSLLKLENLRLERELKELAQNGEVEAFDDSLYQLCNEENSRLKDEIIILKEELKLARSQIGQLHEALAKKENDVKLQEEKLESMRHHTLMKVVESNQDELITEYTDKLVESEQKLKEMTAEAANHKVKWLQLHADYETMQENYDTQIADLSAKLVDTLAQAGRR